MENFIEDIGKMERKNKRKESVLHMKIYLCNEEMTKKTTKKV